MTRRALLVSDAATGDGRWARLARTAGWYADLGFEIAALRLGEANPGAPAIRRWREALGAEIACARPDTAPAALARLDDAAAFDVNHLDPPTPPPRIAPGRRGFSVAEPPAALDARLTELGLQVAHLRRDTATQRDEALAGVAARIDALDAASTSERLAFSNRVDERFDEIAAALLERPRHATTQQPDCPPSTQQQITPRPTPTASFVSEMALTFETKKLIQAAQREDPPQTSRSA
ncbi:MAG: hypothetical protein AAF322_03205, partial [Pseudomonadota bacterium]